MSRSRQIAINVLSQSGVTLLNAGLGLLLVPFLIAKLGRDGYGLIAVTIAISGACAMADLGICGALGRQLAEALAKRDDNKYRELLSTALGLNLLIGSACALTVFVLAPELAKSFSLPGPLFDTGVLLLRTYGALHVVFILLMTVLKAVLVSHNRFDTSSQIDGIRRLFETAGLFLVLAGTGAGIAGWAVVCLTMDAVCTMLLWRAAAKTHTGLGVGISSMRFTSARDLFGLGSQFTLLQIGGQLSVSADPFILTACLGPSSVSLYRPPAQVLSAISPLIATLSNQTDTLATTAHVEGDKNDLDAILFRGTKYTMLMGAVFCAVVIVLANPLCKIWLERVLGDEYRISGAVLTIQAIVQLAIFGAGTQWSVLLGMRRTAFAVYGRLAFAVVNVVSSCLLVRYTALGVLGVVLPTMVIELIWRPIQTYYICRLLDLCIWEYIKQAYLPPLMIGSVVAALGFAAGHFWTPLNLWSLAASAGALGLIGSSLIWLVGFNRADRAAMVRVVQFPREMSPESGQQPVISR